MYKVLIIALCSFCLADASIYGQLDAIANDKHEVQTIPTPIVSFYARIPNEKGVINLPSGAMKAQLGLNPYCPNIALDIKITVISYTLSYTKKRCPAVEYKSTSAKFEGDIANAIKSAEVGEIYVFKDIVVQILGEPTTRLLNPLTVYIK